MNKLMKIIKQPQKIMYGLEKIGLLDWMNDENYIRLTYWLAFGRKIDLENPKAYTEKINWCKLYWRDPLAKKCVDKYEVRAYVEKTIGKAYLNDFYGLWQDVEEIDFDTLPEQFVLKPTNGSGDVVICSNRQQFDTEYAKRILGQNSRRHFSSKTREWAYYDLPYRIIGEKYLESTDEYQIKDYKFFCFHGEPKFLYVASERGTEHLKFDFFDMDWNWLPVTNSHEHNPHIEKPQCFSEMIEVARKLSKAFPHVRVDLYEVNGKVYFGELTFYHMSGFTRFEPDEWDYFFGEYFDISKVTCEK